MRVSELPEALPELPVVQAFPKPVRLKDKSYLAWVRRQPCLVDYVVAEAHHTVSRGAGGSDYRSVPLCIRHHKEVHRMGREAFQVKYRLDFGEEIVRLMEIFISARGDA
jgi:hypothetical protein